MFTAIKHEQWMGILMLNDAVKPYLLYHIIH